MAPRAVSASLSAPSVAAVEEELVEAEAVAVPVEDEEASLASAEADAEVVLVERPVADEEA